MVHGVVRRLIQSICVARIFSGVHLFLLGVLFFPQKVDDFLVVASKFKTQAKTTKLTTPTYIPTDRQTGAWYCINLSEKRSTEKTSTEKTSTGGKKVHRNNVH